jgi:hypothetical protein
MLFSRCQLNEQGFGLYHDLGAPVAGYMKRGRKDLCALCIRHRYHWAGIGLLPPFSPLPQTCRLLVVFAHFISFARKAYRTSHIFRGCSLVSPRRVKLVTMPAKTGVGYALLAPAILYKTAGLICILSAYMSSRISLRISIPSMSGFLNFHYYLPKS